MSQDQAPDPGMRSILAYSLVAGLLPLIPVPFVDDLIIGLMRRRMLRGLFRPQVQLSRPQVKALTRRPMGCLWGCLLFPILFVVKRLFRKIIYVLAIKACVDTASTLLHEGLLVRYALRSGLVSHLDLQRDETRSLEVLNEAVHRSLEETDPKPITQVIRRAWRGGRMLLRRGRDTARQELMTVVWADQGYLPDLYARLDRHWVEVIEEKAAEE